MKELSDVTKQFEIVNLIQKNGPMTVEALSKLTGRKLANVLDSLKLLRKKRLVHISGYAERSYPNCMHHSEWDIGDWPDAKRPAPIPNKQKKKDFRRRHAAVLKVQKNPDRYQSLGVWRGLV